MYIFAEILFRQNSIVYAIAKEWAKDPLGGTDIENDVVDSPATAIVDKNVIQV